MRNVAEQSDLLTHSFRCTQTFPDSTASRDPVSGSSGLLSGSRRSKISDAWQAIGNFI